MVARKKSSSPTKIWTFGCHPPKENIELFNKQLELANNYYNKLVEIENNRRKQYISIRSECFPNYSKLESEIEELNDEILNLRNEIKLRNQQNRKKEKYSDLNVKIKKIKKERNDKNSLLKKYRSEIKQIQDEANKEFNDRCNDLAIKKYNTKFKDFGPASIDRAQVVVDSFNGMLSESQWHEFWKRTKKLDFDTVNNIKTARGNCSIGPGTYLLIEKAFEAAKSKSKFLLKYNRNTGEGRIGLQIRNKPTKHTKFSDLLTNKDNKIKIYERDISKNRYLIKLKIGEIKNSDNKKENVFVDFDVILHRKIPNDAIIRGIWIKKSKSGPKYKYELQFTLESELLHNNTSGTGVVALDFGWRKLNSGDRRVLYCVDDTGYSDECILPKKFYDRITYISSLHSVSEILFNEARANFSNYLKNHSLDDELKITCKDINKWKKHAKLANVSYKFSRTIFNDDELNNLWKQWKDYRLNNKLDLFCNIDDVKKWLDLESNDKIIGFYLEIWRRKNKHLFQMESNLRKKTINQRNDIYRKFAYKLRNKYKTILVEQINIKDFCEDDQAYQHKIISMCAPGKLKLFIEETKDKEEIKAENTTKTCHKCNNINQYSDPKNQFQECSKCGEKYDRDYNACKVMLKQYFESFGDAKSAVASRPAENSCKNDNAIILNAI